MVNSADDDEDNEPTTDEEALIMAERLNDRRVLMAAFLKLCMFSVVDMKLAAPLWEQYIRVSRGGGFEWLVRNVCLWIVSRCIHS